MHTLITGLMIAIWMAVWGLGGLWLVRAAFRLSPREEALGGLACGLLVETFLANLLAQWLPLPLACWLAAGLTMLAGLALALREGVRRLFNFTLVQTQLVAFVLLALLAYQVNRGLAIQDDYAHLTVTSIMATGDIPPRFPFNPQASYDYHYFGLLFSAQVMRVGGMFAWTAVDIMRALTFSLGILLITIWTHRVTRSPAAGVLGGIMTAFGGGARWLLLLLPPGFLTRISASLQMLGTGAASGPDLRSALLGLWAIDGGGPLAYPFAAGNGIYAPGVFAMFGSNGLALVMLLGLFLLTGSRWKGWPSIVVSGVFVACMALISETTILFWLAGWGVAGVWLIIRRRRFTLPTSFLRWSLVILSGGLVALAQGGTLTGLAKGLLFPSAAGLEHYQITFDVSLAPILVSGHLGELRLLNVGQLMIALCEVGPLIVLFPMLAHWCRRAFRAQRWFEVILILNAFLSLGILFVHFTGSGGIRNTSRMYEFMRVLVLFAIPLAWFWTGRQGEVARAAVVGIGVTAMVGGLVVGFTSLAAIQKPVLSVFINDLDTKMAQQYWNQLPEDALVFDRKVSRPPVVLGRYTYSNTNWWDNFPFWEELAEHPDLSAMRSAGFTYVYYDRDTWERMDTAGREEMAAPCAVLVGEVQDSMGDFRRLLDIRACPIAP